MILDQVIPKRRLFDVNNKKDVDAYKFFLTNSKWDNSCPFILEEPFLSIPDMIKDKLVHKNLKVEKRYD